MNAASEASILPSLSSVSRTANSSMPHLDLACVLPRVLRLSCSLDQINKQKIDPWRKGSGEKKRDKNYLDDVCKYGRTNDGDIRRREVCVGSQQYDREQSYGN